MVAMNRWAVALAFAVTSSQCFAIFDVQGLVGYRSATFKEEGASTSHSASGTDIGAAFHIDPIPLVPVALGLYVSQQTYASLPDDYRYNGITGVETGIQVYAWSPIGLMGLKPYAKLGYPLYSAFKADAEQDVGEVVDYSMLLTSSGAHFAIGAQWKILPLLPIALLVEYDMGMQTLTDGDVTLAAGVDESVSSLIPVTTHNYSSGAIVVGVQVGL